MLFQRTVCVFLLGAGLFPLPAIADLCSGKYAPAASILDAAFSKYGTLYSGGYHLQAFDDIGATLDLYRLWRGLPDVAFRNLAYNFRFDSYDRPDPADDLPMRLESVESVEPGDTGDVRRRWETAIELDLATVLEEPRDSWKRSAQYPLLDWLNMTMIASDTPWSLAGHLNNPADSRYTVYRKLRSESLRHFADTAGLQWAVAAQLLSPPNEEVAQLDKLFAQWHDKVLSCAATPGEYAAWATAAASRWLSPSEQTLAMIQDPVVSGGLPKTVLEVIAKNLASEVIIHRDQFALQLLTGLADMTPDPAVAAWIGVAGTYHSASIEQLIRVLNGKQISPYTVRALNLLSVVDLTTLWRTTELPAQLHTALLGTIFARYVSLGRNDEAYGLLGELKKAYPEYRERVAEIDDLWIPLDTKLALIAMDNPLISNWLKVSDQPGADYALHQRNTHQSKDLPIELASGIAIQDDYEIWLMLPIPTRRAVYSDSPNAGLNRVYWSGERLPPLLPEIDYSLISAPNARPTKTDINNLIAWDELSKLTPEHGLTHVISHSIVSWARDESSGWFKRLSGHRAEVSEALRRTVLLNRDNDGGRLDGVAAGKAAFRLLHVAYANTRAAELTRYWHESQCESQMGREGKCWRYDNDWPSLLARESPKDSAFDYDVTKIPDASVATVDKYLSGEMLIGDETVRLPEGSWRAIADVQIPPGPDVHIRTVWRTVNGHDLISTVSIEEVGTGLISDVSFPANLPPVPATAESITDEIMKPDRGDNRLLILVRESEHQVTDVLAIRSIISLSNGFFAPPDNLCIKDADYFPKVKESFHDGSQLCSWINHSETPWEQPIYRLAADQLREQGFSLPDSAIVSGFYRSDRHHQLTTQYYTFPGRIPHAADSIWATSSWNPLHLRRYAANQQYMEDRIKWAAEWMNQFRKPQ